MTDRFIKFFTQLIKNEGGFSDDKNDSGGATIYGISVNNFPSQYSVIHELYQKDKPNALLYAQSFYNANFYKPIYDRIKDEQIAFKLFDLGVNMGMIPPIKMLQRSCGVPDDGIFGECTLNAVNSKDCYKLFIAEAEKYYVSLVNKNPQNAKFLNGWLNRLRTKI